MKSYLKVQSETKS